MNEIIRRVKSNWFNIFLVLPITLLYIIFYPENYFAASGVGFLLLGLGMLGSIHPKANDIFMCIFIAIGVLLICKDMIPNIGYKETYHYNLRKEIFWPLSMALLSCWIFVSSRRLTVIINNHLRSIPFRDFLNNQLTPSLERQNEAIERLEKAQVQRLEKLIKSHALYTSLGHFERILEIVGKKSKLAKFAMARMISEVLNKVFLNSDYCKIAGQKYQDFAEVFQNCLITCQSVRLTCIYSPENWFNKLNSGAPRSREWIDIDIPGLNLSDLDPAALRKMTDTPGQDYRYPRHYAAFLSVKEPKRIFLLGDEEWENLKRNRVAFEKFMRPCEGKVYTLFVCLKDFVQQVFSKDNNISLNPFLSAQKDKLDTLDLNLFEREACMEWDGENIKFIFSGSQLDSYNLLFDYIINEIESDPALAKTIGIYTFEDIRNEVLI